MKPISHIEFSKQVKAHYGYDIKVMNIERKSTRVFVKKAGDQNGRSKTIDSHNDQ
jgi:hypothetical protein